MGGLNLEVIRFGLNLGVPIAATYIYTQPDCIDFIVRKWKYITYPPQSTSREELEQKAKEVAQDSDMHPPQK